MIIQINERKRLRSDSYCWIIEKLRGKDKDGKEIYGNATYHADVVKALGSSLEQDIRHVPNVLEFKEAMLKVRELTAFYEGLLSGIKAELK